MSNWLGRLGADGIFENDLYQMNLTVGADLFAGKNRGIFTPFNFRVSDDISRTP
jgi:hypothetical protein